MDASSRRSPRVKLAIPVRVRGMSIQNKFFDEKTETILVSQHGFMTQIRGLVELGVEIHVVSLKNNVEGTFNVVWVNTQDQNGFYQLGLEVIDAEADMWGIHFPPTQPTTVEATAQAWLECKRCHLKELASVPQAELEHLAGCVLVARQCDRCKATTPWEFRGASETSPSPPDALQSSSATPVQVPPKSSVQASSAPSPPIPLAPLDVVVAVALDAENKAGVDRRGRRRSPIKLTVKVERNVYGNSVEDIGETINVSRNGAYFLISQNYGVGEIVKIVLPYKRGDLALPVVAKVIRQDQPKGTFEHAIAVHMETTVSIPELGKETAEAPRPATPDEKKAQADKRSRTRVPLKMPIKVDRKIFGADVEDFGETINISRESAFFQTSQNYNVGEIVQVVLPYKKDEMAIPVSARVVRQDSSRVSFGRAVAVFMGGPKK